MAVLTPTRLGLAALSSTISTVYTTPSSTTTLVKDLNFCNTSSTDTAVSLYVVPLGQSAAASNAVLFNAVVPANSALQWSGLIVLNATDTLQAWAASSNITVIVSGAQQV